MRKLFHTIIFIALFFLTTKIAFGATEVVRTIKPSGQGGDYTTLAAWEAGEQKDLVATDEIAVAKIDGNWSTPDTTAVAIDGWTTDATRYIKIYTTEQARHSGKWDAEKYNLSITNNSNLDIYEDYVIVDGLQIKHTDTSASALRGIRRRSSSGIITIRSNIIFGVISGAGAISGFYSEGGTAVDKIYNNIIYNFTNDRGILIQGGSSYIYNNTIINCSKGIERVSGTTIAKNNIVKGSGNTNAYIGTFAAGTDYNATDGTDNIGQGSNNRTSQTFTFADEANDDFHLNSTDTGAKNAGANLYADANIAVTTDIDGQARPNDTTFDIGADEVGGNTRVVFSPDPGQETNFGAATAIYRSVGPSNTTALAVGTSNTLTITGSTATFASPLPDRIGVGDALQYDDDNDSDIDASDSIVFIHARTNSKTYTVKTASGGVPTAVASDNNWSIFRAYTSLSLAEAGTENTGIDSDLRNFDTWSNGKDITASNEVWNIACYGDAADTTAVTIDGWTTGASNYIRIYTPVSKQEVGASQRHRGKWSGDRYRLSVTNASAIDLRDDYITLNGLQIETLEGNSNGQYPVVLSGAFTASLNQINISGSVLKGHGNVSYAQRLIYANTANLNLNIWNTLAYNLNSINTSNYGVSTNQPTATINIYNSVFIGGYIGIYQTNGALNCKNVYAGEANVSDYSGAISKTTCASSDTSGSISLQNIAYSTANFSNVTSGSEDLHIKSNSALKNVGTNTSGDPAPLNFATDIDGQARVGSWDIGADERPANTVIKGGVRITK